MVQLRRRITWALMALLMLSASVMAQSQPQLKRVPESPSCVAMQRHGNYLFTAGYKGMAIFDISQPLEPKLIKRMPEIGGRQMAISNNRLYITARQDGLWILDISNPADTKVINRFDTVELATGVAVAGNIVFLAQRIYGVEILDCTDAKNPRHLGLLRGGEVQSVGYHNQRLYAGAWGHGRVSIWDVADLSKPKELGRFQLDGFGDGVFIDGKYCYAATGMHAKSGPAEKRTNNGHGLEIFDISNPAKPVLAGRVKFPPCKTLYFDSWTVVVQGDTAYVGDNNNGFFLVDVKDKSNPKVISQIKLPQDNNREDAIGAFSLGDEVVYIGGFHGGVYVMPWKGVSQVKPNPGKLPAGKGVTFTAPKGFTRYDVGGQVRRVFLDGDTLYAACSHRGVIVYQLTDEKLVEKHRFPIGCSYDVVVRDGLLYSAEGPGGLVIYRIEANNQLKELGRYKGPIQNIRLVSDKRWAIVSGGAMHFDVVNISDPAKPTKAFRHQGGGIFYTDTISNLDLDGIIPVNRHGGGIVWLDLNGPEPKMIHHDRKSPSSQMSAPALMGKKFVFPAGNRGVVVFDPMAPENGTQVPVRGLNYDGTTAVDGNLLAMCSRERGNVQLLDFADPAKPKVVEHRRWMGIQGSPGRPSFWKGRLIIPAGFQGLLVEDAKNLIAPKAPVAVKKEVETAAPLAGPWSGITTRMDRNQRDLLIERNRQRLGHVRDAKLSQLVKATATDHVLTIDTTEFIKAHGETDLHFYYYLKPLPGKKVQMEVELAGTPGSTVTLLFEGRTTKHYWKAKSIMLKEQMTTYVFETDFPADLKYVSCRVSFKNQPVLKVGRIHCDVKVEEAIANPQTNHIFNGGAERGMYNVFPSTPNRYGATTGTVTVDSTQFRSGKHSFRIDPVKKGMNRLHFNAVPYQTGKPIVFSMWMKAEKPNTAVSIGLFTHHGSAYSQWVNVGSEWKKYELMIPSFGGAAPKGVSKFGNPAMTASFSHVTPIVDANGRIWLDDAACQLSSKSDDFTAQGLFLAGKIESKHGYIYAGEQLKGQLQLDAAAPQQVKLGWELVNWCGEKVQSGTMANQQVPGKIDFTVNPPKGLLGPVNLIFTAEGTDGKQYTHTFYTGIIRNAGKPVERWGTNVHVGPAEFSFLARLLADFGVGSVRLWSKHGMENRGGFASAKTFHDAGFHVMMNISGDSPGCKNHLLIDSTELIDKYFKDAIIANREYVDEYELLNEPEIWGGRSPNPDPSRFCEATAENSARAFIQMAKAIRKLDPKVRFSGPGGHVRPDYIEPFLKAGALEYMDSFTEHPYRQLPEMPSLDDAQQALQAVIRKLNPNLSIVSSESGNMNFPTLPDNRINPLSMSLAARDLRYALIEFGNGIKTYYHFQAGGISLGYAWTSLLGDPQHHWAPGFYLYAVRNAADILGDTISAGRLQIGVNKRCYLYDRGDHRVAVLWQWEGNSETMVFDTPVEFYDMMGNLKKADRIRLSEYPVYITSKLSLDALKKQISSAKQMGIQKPLTYAVELCDANNFYIRLDNRASQTLQGNVQCAGQRLSYTVQGEKSTRLKFRAPSPISLKPQNLPMQLQIHGFPSEEHTVDVKGFTVPKAPKRLTIDGDLADWPANATTFVLDKESAHKLVPWSAAEDAYRTELRFSWDSSAFYLAVTVFKDKFTPDDRYGKGAIWRGDSLQVGIDTMKNATAETRGMESDDFEYIIGSYQGRPLVWRHHSSSAIWDSFAKEGGDVKDVKLAIRQFPGKVVYEMAFSQVSVSPFKLVAGSSCRMTVMANISNGEKRIGWHQLSPGMGAMPIRPFKFMDISLTE